MCWSGGRKKMDRSTAARGGFVSGTDETEV